MRLSVMQAAVYTDYGPPGVLKVKTVAKPSPGDKEVLVRVHAATVNRTDCAILTARPFIMRLVTGLFKPKKQIPGTTFAGQIETVGKDVMSFSVGDRVYGFDDSGLSGQAEYLIISDKKAFEVIPENVTYSQAAASIEGFHYALNIINKVQLKVGHRVLVNGATGAIGTAAVQLLINHGAVVVAVGNTKNLELLASLGAARVIDYTREDFTSEDEKYDYIIDAVGKSSFGKCKPHLRPGGAYISTELGRRSENIFFALTTLFMGDKKVIIPIPADIRGSILQVSKMLKEGKFIAVIDRDYPLQRIADAYEYVCNGVKTGNVLITLASDIASEKADASI